MVCEAKNKVALDLQPLCNPKSVAIIGCSQNPKRLSGRPFYFLRKFNYQGKIYPVNPKYDEIDGIKCYPSIKDVPEPVDVALLLIPAASIEGALKECIEAGTKSAIIFSSGFAELGEEGREVQTRIGQLAKEANMPVLGPNCLGVMNLANSIPLSFSSALDVVSLRPGGLALVSQSGAIGTFILGAAEESKIGFSYWVTTGNEAALNAETVAQYLLQRDDVSGVLLYLEESRDPEGLAEAGRLAKEVGKPLIGLKVGRYSSGKRAAMSHTGSMAGADEEYTAAFRKAGIVRAAHIEELFDLGLVLSDGIKPKGKRAAIVTMTGGGGILTADRCEEVGLEVPLLSEETQAKLAEVVPSFGAVGNPVDVTAELVASPGLLKQTLNIIIEAPDVDAIIVFIGMQKLTGANLAKDIAAMSEVAKAAGKPILVAWMAAPEEAIEILRAARVPLLYDAVRTVNALAHLVEKPEKESETTCGHTCADKAAGLFTRENLRSLLIATSDPQDVKKERFALTEAAGKKFLAKLGLSIPQGDVAKTAADAVAIAEKIGYPVVAKVDSPDILHKSDAGAVKVGLKNAEELTNAFAAIIENAKLYDPSARVNGVLVEEMVTGDPVQTIVGLKWSEKFGPMVVFGTGGIFVELLKDFSMRLAPVTEAEALSMLAELKTAKMFKGFRGAAPRDLQATAKAIATISQIGAALGEELLELDINPLFILPEGEGVKVGDALIVVKGE
jgi:acyl-CoA synthetase (NDP forming)